jgi:hypothetical protein
MTEHFFLAHSNRANKVGVEVKDKGEATKVATSLYPPYPIAPPSRLYSCARMASMNRSAAFGTALAVLAVVRRKVLTLLPSYRDPF